MQIVDLDLFEKFNRLKGAAGTHSPSIATLRSELPELEIKVDACFLSNPYATELFLKYFNEELLSTNEINKVLEFYPSQNKEISKSVAKHLDIDPDQIFIGNGATEIIQAILHNFVKGKVVVNIPTFSPYYEFVTDDSEVVYYSLKKEDNYRLNSKHYVEFVKKTKPQAIVIINPNNPDGGYISNADLLFILNELKDVPNIILDESFIHFAFEDSSMHLPSVVREVSNLQNVYIIKSMSKDFGIAGIRCGYAIMPKDKVAHLLKNGFLWNSSGLAEYFFRLYTREDFLKEYEIVRKKYITESLFFITELGQIPKIKVYPTKANFVLVEILNGVSSQDITVSLLLNYGIYVRNCSDKIGLQGEFIRIASRNKDENEYIVRSFKDLFI
jgi:histidinol-phosphate/aromatic aminotransferase/cobyric acid decarboxylase-like protein